jgi:hypothetical protein
MRAKTKRSLSLFHARARDTGYHKACLSAILHFKNNFQASLNHRAKACSCLMKMLLKFLSLTSILASFCNFNTTTNRLLDL